MKYMLFNLLFSVIAVPAFADGTMISLKNQKLELPGFPYRISEVVDARDQTYCIGMVQRGMTNKKTPAFLEQGLIKEFSDLFNRSFTPDQELQALIVRVNKLQIYEITYSNKELAIVEISLSFVIPEGDHFAEICAIGSTLEAKGLDVTHKHDDNIAKAIRECLAGLFKQTRAGRLHHKVIKAEELRQNLLNEPDYPILSSGKPKRGIYYTFSDFLDNNPALENGIDFELKLKTYKNHEAVKAVPEWKPAPPNEEIWGLSDGENVYVNMGSGLFQINRDSGNFIFYGPEAKDGVGMMIFGAIYGGAIGVTIAYFFDGPGSKTITKYKIDLATGALVPFEEPAYRKIESKLTLVSSMFNPADQELTLFLDGKQYCVMQKGTACRLRLPPPEQPVEICIESGGKRLCESVTPELFKTKLAMFRIKRDKLYIDWPSGDTRGELLSKVKSGELKAVCGGL